MKSLEGVERERRRNGGEAEGAAGGVPGILRALSGSPRPGLCKGSGPASSKIQPRGTLQAGGHSQAGWGQKRQTMHPFPVATLPTRPE